MDFSHPFVLYELGLSNDSFNKLETIINHSIDIVCDVSLDRTNTHFDAVHFSKTRDPNRWDTQIGRMEFATDYISFETNYISSGINSISFEITCKIDSFHVKTASFLEK